MRHFTREEYQAYLISPEWQEKRQTRLKIDGFRCRSCGKVHSPEEPLQTHHLNYYHFGSENIWTDIESLCPDCHQKAHNMLCRPTGVKPDGSYRYGWKDSLPDYIAEDLRKRGLM